MPFVDKVFQAVDHAHGYHQGKNHGKTGIYGTGNEIRWKNRSMPPWNHRNGKIEADNTVY